MYYEEVDWRNSAVSTLTMLNQDISCFENSYDPDQLTRIHTVFHSFQLIFDVPVNNVLVVLEYFQGSNQHEHFSGEMWY